MDNILLIFCIIYNMFSKYEVYLIYYFSYIRISNVIDGFFLCEHKKKINLIDFSYGNFK